MRARRTDSNHRAVLDAIRMLGYPCMSLHAHGGGLEDIIVGLRCPADKPHCPCNSPGHRRWVLVECKVPNKSGGVKPSKFTDAQREWYAQTEGFPRLVVTSAQDAVEQIRRMAG